MTNTENKDQAGAAGTETNSDASPTSAMIQAAAQAADDLGLRVTLPEAREILCAGFAAALPQEPKTTTLIGPGGVACIVGGDAAEFPAGAIHNGEVFADRLESIYDFQCEAGPLRNCYEWTELRRCMKHVADYLTANPAAAPSPQAATTNTPFALMVARADLDEIGAWGAQQYEDGKRAAIAAKAEAPAPIIEYVPIATDSHDVAGGTHTNDKISVDKACQDALDVRGDDRGQGLDPYWKWGYRAGWHDRTKQAEAQAPAGDAVERLSSMLWRDLKSDADRSNWLLSGRGYATGVIALAIQSDVAMAYHRLAILSQQAEAEPVAHEGCVLMPARLTAENGAKGALSGEFKESHTVSCWECDGNDDECTECDGTGRVEQSVTVGWDTIKRIYERAVELLATPSIPERAEDARDTEIESKLDNALWLLMDLPIHRYLMSCAHGRWDGSEKARRHIELCQIFLAVEHGCVDLDEVRREHNADYEAVHNSTQRLTDHMDDVIGFPLEEAPNYALLGPMFFDWFIKYAREAMSAAASTNQGEKP